MVVIDNHSEYDNQFEEILSPSISLQLILYYNQILFMVCYRWRM